MINFFRKLKNKVNAAAITAKTYIEDKKAEGYVDSGVKILIAVVIGAYHAYRDQQGAEPVQLQG